MQNIENFVHFHKMNALGNDFLILLNDENHVANLENFLTKERIQKLSNRFRAIGFDQLILLKKLDIQDNFFEMIIFNQDGSKAEICGNATRCCVFLIFKQYKIEYTKIKSGPQILSCFFDQNENLSKIFFENKPSLGIPIDFSEENFFKNKNFSGEILNHDQNFSLKINFENFSLIGFYINIGNPHLVFFIDKKFNWSEMNQIGKIICDAQIFPNGINIGFCKKISNDSCILKVFERGVGLTLACGSGACASSFLGVQNQIFESNLINVYFLENEISDDLDKNNLIQVEINDLKTILMIGTSEYVFSGKIREDF